MCFIVIYFDRLDFDEKKEKTNKWNILTKIFGSGAAKAGTGGFLLHFEELREFLLLAENVKQEGIFRKTGSIMRQMELRLAIDNEEPLDLKSNKYTVHDCASIFKSCVLELPAPLLTYAHYPAYLQLAEFCRGAHKVIDSNINPEFKKVGEDINNTIQLLVLLYPVENRRLLQRTIELLHEVAENEQFNKMDASNLATLFAPSLICPRNLSPEALLKMSEEMFSLIRYMILRGSDVFGVPAKLALDIRISMERKQSGDDNNAVMTVYTFLDRKLTEHANKGQITEIELAKLYAYIRSLPESADKRKWVKKFNKGNGQGAPLHLVDEVAKCLENFKLK